MLATGQTLQQRYRVESLLGQGGMGSVYRATHIRLGTKVALKELHVLSPDANEQRRFREQFETEAKILAGLSHPNLARVTDFFDEGATAYLVMEFIEGRTLEEIVLRGTAPLDAAAALRVAAQLLEALDYLHSRIPPVVVRDLKPSNVMVSPDRRVRLIDFGIARLLTPGQGTKSVIHGVGSEGFAPLEQYGMGSTDTRTDLYALGATLLFMLTRRVPPEAIARVTDAAPLLDARTVNPSVSDALWEATEALMSLAPANRPADVMAARRVLGVGVAAASGIGAAAPGAALAGPPTPAVSTAPRSAAPTTPAALPASSTVAAPRAPPGLRFSGMNAQGYREFANEKDGSVGIEIPGGAFQMGDSDQSDNQPRSVTLPAYWIGKYPVTNAQYRRFVSATGHQSAGNWQQYARQWGDQAPVVEVSWNDAVAYCQWAGLRLPTEEEWEKAARGTDGRKYPWGNEWDASRCRNRVGHASSGAALVGSYHAGASPYGCLDMAGNVWQWTASRYNSSHDWRVLRGGSWGSGVAVYFRAAYRSAGSPGYLSVGDGLRVARIL